MLVATSDGLAKPERAGSWEQQASCSRGITDPPPGFSRLSTARGRRCERELSGGARNRPLKSHATEPESEADAGPDYRACREVMLVQVRSVVDGLQALTKVVRVKGALPRCWRTHGLRSISQ